VRHTLGRARREWTSYLFLAPGLLLFSVFTVFALGFAFSSRRRSDLRSS